MIPPRLKIEGISHITLICKSLERSAHLFKEVFNAVEVYSSDRKNFSVSREKFFLIEGLWIALMEGNPIERSYNHIAFCVREENLPLFESRIKTLKLEILPSRPRSSQEGKSIYFYDYDNHLFELHVGDLKTRLNYYQSSTVNVRTAEQVEIDWINTCYDQVDFVHSNFKNEIIAIAELEGQKVGLGRLVKIDENCLELGGMYIFENFRGKGIAKEIVKFLLSCAKPHQSVYCIPFEHLLSFYKEFGFTICEKFETVPQEIISKYEWCRGKYTQPTALLKLNPR